MSNKNNGNNIVVNFKRPSGDFVSLSVKKTDKPIDMIPQLQQEWPCFRVNDLIFNGKSIFNCEKTWTELTKENSINVGACGITNHAINKENVLVGKGMNPVVVNWKFVLSGPPFLVLTLLALILQLNIVFMIISFVIGLILIVIGLCPKIRSYRPKEILSPIKNQNESKSCQNIDRNRLLSQNHVNSIDINM